MHDDLTMNTVDRDGALAETAGRLGETRAGFLAKSAVAGGGLVGGGAVLGLLAPAALAQEQEGEAPASDTDIANFALTLEELEAAFYAEAIARGSLTGEALQFAQVAGAHEAEHVTALRGVLGPAAIARPTFAFGAATADPAAFLATAIELEATGVQAYKGQAPLIRSRALLAAALSIHSVEAKHTAWVRLIAGRVPIPVPLDKPLTRENVLSKLGRTGFIVAA
jgi:rubrerythrin